MVCCAYVSIYTLLYSTALYCTLLYPGIKLSYDLLLRKTSWHVLDIKSKVGNTSVADSFKTSVLTYGSEIWGID